MAWAQTPPPVPVPSAAASPDSTAGEGAEPERAGDVQRYAVVIHAPDDVLVLMSRYLELVRRQYDADIDRDQLELLVDRAQRQTRTLLSTEGYFSPEISAEFDIEASPWKVTLDVKPGEPIRVSSVDIEIIGAGQADAQAFYNQRAFGDLFQLRVGDRFRQQAWDASKNAVLRGFLLDRFPEARIAFSQARIDKDAGNAALKLQIDAGEQRFFGDTQISGLKRYPESLIRGTDPIEPGAPYQQGALLQLQNDLQALPQFKSASVTADLAHAENGRVPVHVDIEENPESRVQIGLGYSSNTRQRVQFGYSDFNVFNRGWRFDSLLKLEKLEQSIDTGIKLPKRLDGWQDSTGASFKRSDVEGLITRTGLFEVKRERKDPSFERGVNLRYYYSTQDLADGEHRLARALAPGFAWTMRRLDDVAYPREGFVLNVQLAGAVQRVFSDATFLRAYGKAVGVLPIGERDALSVRLEGGIVTAHDRTKVPGDLLFRAGGDQSIRGYAYQSIGIEEGGSIVGGRYLVLGGTEYTHWISKAWGVGVFADTGDAFDQLTAMTLNTGVGFGPRWRSPVGPINFDLAYGEQTHQFRLHFSLGIVF